MLRVLIVLAALWPGAALAWNDCCDTPGACATVEAVVQPTGRNTVCHDTVAATATDSSILTVSQCDHMTIQFDPDADGTATAATAYLYQCTTKTASTAFCEKMLGDTDFDGALDDTTLNGASIGRIGQKWQNAAWIYVDMQDPPGSGDYARTMVVCH